MLPAFSAGKCSIMNGSSCEWKTCHSTRLRVCFFKSLLVHGLSRIILPSFRLYAPRWPLQKSFWVCSDPRSHWAAHETEDKPWFVVWWSIVSEAFSRNLWAHNTSHYVIIGRIWTHCLDSQHAPACYFGGKSSSVWRTGSPCWRNRVSSLKKREKYIFFKFVIGHQKRVLVFIVEKHAKQFVWSLVFSSLVVYRYYLYSRSMSHHGCQLWGYSSNKLLLSRMGIVSKVTVRLHRWEIDKQDKQLRRYNLNLNTVEGLKNMSKNAHVHGFQSFYCGKIYIINASADKNPIIIVSDV